MMYKLRKVAGSPHRDCLYRVDSKNEAKQQIQRSTNINDKYEFRKTPFGNIKVTESIIEPRQAPQHRQSQKNKSLKNAQQDYVVLTFGLGPTKRRFKDGAKIAIESNGSVSVCVASQPSHGECKDESSCQAISISPSGRQVRLFAAHGCYDILYSCDIARQPRQVQELFHRAVAWLERRRQKTIIAQVTLPLRQFVDKAILLKARSNEDLFGIVKCFVKANGPHPDFDVVIAARESFDHHRRNGASDDRIPCKFEINALVKVKQSKLEAIVAISLNDDKADESDGEKRRPAYFHSSRSIIALNRDKGATLCFSRSECFESMWSQMEERALTIALDMATKVDKVFEALCLNQKENQATSHATQIQTQT